VSTERKVQTAAAKAVASREALELAIRDMHAGGTSLRKLAELTGLSHETVRRIVNAA
jgi:transposase-like protein